MGNFCAAEGGGHSPRNSITSNICRFLRINPSASNNNQNHLNQHHHHLNGTHHHQLSMSAGEINNNNNRLSSSKQGIATRYVPYPPAPPDLLTGDHLPQTLTNHLQSRSSNLHLNSTNLLHELTSANHQQQQELNSDNNNLRSSLNNLVNNNNSNSNSNSNSNNPNNSQQQLISATNGINGTTSNNNINSTNNTNNQQPKIIFCLDDFVARDEFELTIRRGDRLLVTDEAHPDWCYVEHLSNKRSGYVPKSFVTSEPFELEEWFFSMTNRREAEKLLMAPFYCRGTYLIRNSEHTNTGFSLSIRDEDHLKNVHIKHYRIKTLDNGGFFVAPRNTFRTLPELINFYSKAQNGLCYRLVKPCPKPKPMYWPDRGKEIRRSELIFKRKIGTGCFGEVFHGCYMGNFEVAIKTLKQGTMSPEAFLAEASIMRKCRHKNLVPLLGICSKEEPLLIVTQYMSNGSLLEYLRNNPEGKNLILPDLIIMAHEIASGMEYLEKVKLIHRDLAARNILVDEDRSVKVADFGLARVIEDSEYTARQGAKFPIKWTAPEAAMYGRFSIKSDVWSYGILLYELVTHGSIPYAGMHNKEVVEQVQRGYRIPKPSNCDCPDEVYGIMRDCWQSDPDRRPTFESLKNYFEAYSISSEQSYRDADCFK